VALAAPLATAAREQSTVLRKIDVGDMKRSYLLHVPRTLPMDVPVPLVLMFHGGSGTPEYAETESRFSELADRERFLVAYPAGYKKSWNDGRNEKAIPAQRDHVDDLAFIAALLDDLGRDYRIDARRIYATGISNGAAFSHYLAARMSTRICGDCPGGGRHRSVVER
jgi:polyhydroxybutyrate depolymerase